MEQAGLCGVIADQADRALWETKNVIRCVPDEFWCKPYCGAPFWKHIYHTLHSLDLWYINPREEGYQEPPFHEMGLNDLDCPSAKTLSRQELEAYFDTIEQKIRRYHTSLREDTLLSHPESCEYNRFTLILAQHRHLHTHMGMLMGFLIADTGRWPRVLGLEGRAAPDDDAQFYE